MLKTLLLILHIINMQDFGILEVDLKILELDLRFIGGLGPSPRTPQVHSRVRYQKPNQTASKKL